MGEQPGGVTGGQAQPKKYLIVNSMYYVHSHARPRPRRPVVRKLRRGRDNPGSTPGAVMCFVLHREIAVLHLSGPLAPLPV